MTMRNDLIGFTETLWSEAADAAARRDRCSAFTKRETANRLREILRVPPLDVDGGGNGSGTDE